MIFLASTASHTLAQSVTITMLQEHLKHKGGQPMKNNDRHDIIHTLQYIFTGYTLKSSFALTVSHIQEHTHKQTNKMHTHTHTHNRTKKISANPSPPFLKHTLTPLLYVPV